MVRARSTGSGVEVYDPALDPPDGHGPVRAAELRAALERGDLEVFLQPQIDLTKGAVIGAEALARWRHPQDGVLLPASFLPLAAQTGLMRPMAALVLDRALEACAQWWECGHRVPVSVNLTADDLQDPELDGRLRAGLERHRLPASALCVEITEDILVDDEEGAAALLRSWRAEGVSVALDDFGTGYSSLAYLATLPLDELKLDQGFAADLANRRTALIVRHTVELAHALRLRVVAEGVEDEATARQLADAGCDIGQGLYFGPAVTPRTFSERLGRGAAQRR
jgi:EAL domain-containing protein (putative c-di-GMP-specific phosphodiesterase class I)